MKFDATKTILKPGLILFVLNGALCGLFAVAAMLSFGISWIFYDAFGIPFPLMPMTVLGFTLLSLLAWGFFSRRLELAGKDRWIAALAGVSPLIVIGAGALLVALTLLALPVDSAMTIFGPLAIGFTSLAAAAVCTVMIVWMPRKPPAEAPESTPA